MNGILIALLSSAITKGVDGIISVEVRTESLKEIIESYSSQTGFKVNVKVSPPPRYFASKDDYLKTLRNENPLFAQLESELGLRMA